VKSDKELYRRLRVLSCEQLWTEEVPRFDRATPKERMANVGVIRAVGVVFAERGTAAQRAAVRAWLVGLLQDPGEKIRRYAMAAIPKIGAGATAEKELLAVLKTATVDREKKFVGRALDKVGGRATLEAFAQSPGILSQTEQKVKASVARHERPSVVRLDRPFAAFANLRIHLRCRRGLETILREEVEEYVAARRNFRIVEVRGCYVAITPLAPFSLNDLYALRCFATVGFVLGTVRGTDPAASIEALAGVIASPLSRQLLGTFTEGPIRYRLDYVARGHQRGAVRLLANRAYALCPEILNDARSAPWSVDIQPAGRDMLVELRPRLSPDPRLYYRRDDVAAASHPPLAASMARLAGKADNEIVWDPFCGSGLELIERALRGGVQQVYGTDLSPEAIAIARANFAAAKLAAVRASFACCDFRDFGKVEGLGPGTVTLMITNPPMGRRIRIPDMRGLFAELFNVAATVLKPGGRLVFPNPMRLAPTDRSLQRQYRQVVDLGGFSCRLEVYRKTGVQGPSVSDVKEIV
jgi:predicted RNA methylase